MKVVIEGAGEVGSHLAKMLRAEANEVTVSDDNADRITSLTPYADVETVLGNPSSIEILRAANVEKADLFIAVYPLAAHEINIVGALLVVGAGVALVGGQLHVFRRLFVGLLHALSVQIQETQAVLGFGFALVGGQR